MSLDGKARITISYNGRAAIAQAMEMLCQGASALDAVEAACTWIENNPNDWSVGYGGFPNFAGEVELDGSIMNGRTLQAGGVAGLKHHRNPVAVARKVMEETPHVLLIGDGADKFADMQGFPRENLLTDRTREAYARLMRGEQIELWQRVPEEDPVRAKSYGAKLFEVVRERGGWKEVFCAELQGTCHAIAIDRAGDMACAVSTSGLALKMPGRVGDTPIIGAGNYVDNRFGGASCVGNGELCLRQSSARMAVRRLAEGHPVELAAEETIRDAEALPDLSGGFHVLVMDRTGEVWCASNIKAPQFWLMDEGDAEPREMSGSFLEPPLRPGGRTALS